MSKTGAGLGPSKSLARPGRLSRRARNVRQRELRSPNPVMNPSRLFDIFAQCYPYLQYCIARFSMFLRINLWSDDHGSDRFGDQFEGTMARRAHA